jgi:hypothetical protein
MILVPKLLLGDEGRSRKKREPLETLSRLMIVRTNMESIHMKRMALALERLQRLDAQDAYPLRL